MCYNIAIKFRCCIVCGCSKYRYIMTDSLVEVEMNYNILNQSIKREFSIKGTKM